ncbi:retrovirus-related pol polyprotein from transposon TNT 1-94, partial [Tanacetum coccineum]
MAAIEVPHTLKYKGGNPDDEEDIKINHEYLKDLEEEYQARALLSKSKRFFKKGTQRFSSTKATDQTECHKCGKKGHFTRDCWSKTSDFEAKYNKVKVKLALLDSSTLAPSSSDENEVTEVKALMALNNEEIIFVSKESVSNGKWVKISIQMVYTLLEMEDND